MLRALALVLGLLSLDGVLADDQSRGVLELLYEPKSCIRPPCPQFRIISLNGKKVEAMGAILDNLDVRKLGLPAHNRIVVQGRVKKIEENVYFVDVKDWYQLVGEGLQRSQSSKPETSKK